MLLYNKWKIYENNILKLQILLYLTNINYIFLFSDRIRGKGES